MSYYLSYETKQGVCIVSTLSLLGVSPNEAKIGGPSGWTLLDGAAFCNDTNFQLKA